MRRKLFRMIRGRPALDDQTGRQTHDAQAANPVAQAALHENLKTVILDLCRQRERRQQIGVHGGTSYERNQLRMHRGDRQRDANCLAFLPHSLPAAEASLAVRDWKPSESRGGNPVPQHLYDREVKVSCQRLNRDKWKKLTRRSREGANSSECIDFPRAIPLPPDGRQTHPGPPAVSRVSIP